jgi:hypothetical protein
LQIKCIQPPCENRELNTVALTGSQASATKWPVPNS